MSTTHQNNPLNPNDGELSDEAKSLGRRKLRSIVLQVLYEIDCTDHDADAIVTRRIQEDTLNEDGVAFLHGMVSGVLQYRSNLDDLIHDYAPEWPVDQMAIIDRNILRMAIYEMAFEYMTPIKVAINEAVELAKVYASDNAPRFVNGVLGALTANHSELLTLPDDFIEG